MIGKLRVFNSIIREKVPFEPLNPPYVGMYVCGPTVYSDVHLGNVRTFLSFDVINRYLRFLGYKVRYVRNITDVGHLLDSGEDKISKKAKLEKKEPMEVVQRYANDFHQVMRTFNALDPDIEPSATGHLLEQIQMIETLLEQGFAYESNGSVYFDVGKYNEAHHYGILSGRKTDELLSQSRELDGQDDKRSPLDFALWKKAAPEHIMRWPTRWSDGFPGWHLECSVMSSKYLGNTFDIHGGGMDLKFPHHECEIAQCQAANGESQAKYWLHTNMLTVNGQKMSKSLDNSFLPWQLITGNHKLLDQGYSPMTIRFFMLQSHYASTLDFSNDALKAANKGYLKLINGLRILKNLTYPGDTSESLNEKQVTQIEKMCDNCYHAMNDDFNTALTIGHIFNLLKKVNSLYTGQLSFEEIGEEIFKKMKSTILTFTEDVLGLTIESNLSGENMLNLVLQEYKMAKDAKDYDKVDLLRARLKDQGIAVKDMKSGVGWAYEE
ncbi:MAG: cysteine--tRNA ligase [Cyclobacteriaceae bacterium]|nr:cysteine--tRNA ligase [Cyclobacteriaceae bacterium HetDA_MAG_MS6]